MLSRGGRDQYRSQSNFFDMFQYHKLRAVEPSSRRAVEPSSRRAVEPSSRRARRSSRLVADDAEGRVSSDGACSGGSVANVAMPLYGTLLPEGRSPVTVRQLVGSRMAFRLMVLKFILAPHRRTEIFVSPVLTRERLQPFRSVVPLGHRCSDLRTFQLRNITVPCTTPLSASAHWR